MEKRDWMVAVEKVSDGMYFVYKGFEDESL